MPQNWDCQCVPTIDDDVTINLANIPGTPRIGAVPGFARSLTVGGNSPTPQTLYIQNALTIGAGGVTIPANGFITLEASTGTPLTSAGPFNGVNRFLFLSGTLSGSGTFTFVSVNFSGPALKQINSTVVISSFLVVDPGKGGQGVMNIISGSLNIAAGATLRSAESLTISSFTGGSLTSQGSVIFQGGATNVFTLRGAATLASLNIMGGTTTINDDVTITATTVQTGAILNLIGITESKRAIADITGAGILQVQGGSNAFAKMTNIGTVLLQGGIISADASPLSIGTFEQTGGILTGKANVIINSATFTNADIILSPVMVSSATFKGPSTFNSSVFTISQTGVIATDTQLTLSDTAQFVIATTAQVAQSAPMSFLPASPDHPPIFRNNGRWTSTSSLNLVVNTQGTGAFLFGTGSQLMLSGIPFNTNSLTLTAANFTSVGSTVSIGSVSGTGVINAQGQQFVVSGALAASVVNLVNGIVQCATANIARLDAQSGVFNITGSGATVTTLTWEGGTITAPSTATTTTLTVSSLVLTGTQPKTLSYLTATTQTLSLSCGPQQCQLFTLNASLTTKATKGNSSLHHFILS